jgi:hypothetical protein
MSLFPSEAGRPAVSLQIDGASSELAPLVPGPALPDEHGHCCEDLPVSEVLTRPRSEEGAAPPLGTGAR